MASRPTNTSSTRLPWDDRTQSPSRAAEETVADSRRRLWFFVGTFAVALAAIFARQVSLELAEGEIYRQIASDPLIRRQSVPGLRGRIMARDGTILAEDQQHPALALEYRYFEQPLNPNWLRAQARQRLSRAQRRNPALVAAAEEQIRQERAELNRRLATLCNLSDDAWHERCTLVARRVAAISDSVNARRRAQQDKVTLDTHPASGTWRDWIAAVMAPAPEANASAPASIVVAEELAPHVLVDALPLDVVTEIETYPERFPGVHVVLQSRRVYPQGPLAPHVIGHVGPLTAEEAQGRTIELTPSDVVGRAGIERQHDDWLRGLPGQRVIRTRRDGLEISRQIERDPTAGRDLLVTIDPRLQQAAEAVLDQGMARAASLQRHRANSAGGAIVVLDVHTGEILAAASAPRFDPNQFVAPSSEQAAAWLTDPAKPLFDRSLQMAIAPGSLFKVISAFALLESGTLAAAEEFACQGYWQRPDRLRCAIFSRTGKGHGTVDLASALSQSCNTYFFTGVETLDPIVLTNWARDFGLGVPTGVDLPAEVAGQVPDPDQATWRLADTQALAIGQSTLLVTPLQMARVMAAIANGGTLVRPHVVRSAVEGASSQSLPTPFLESLGDDSLVAVQTALEQVVADEQGTAHALATVQPSVAGKTGTAQFHADLPEHAWFAGYVPAERPQFALVVVLEQAGNASTTAVPVTRGLVEAMGQLGCFRLSGQWAQLPPAKSPPRRR